MSKVIVHIDLNAFFARCEEIKDPSLEGKPVAIGHDGRGGIVSTCSYKAREFGVCSGMPMFQAKQLCPNLIIKSSDFRYYWALSATFMNFVKHYTSNVEIASVDECYADFTETIKGVKDVPQFFRQLQKDLFSRTKLMCSIGVGPTKFLAKMGSDYKKPMGLTIIRKSDIPQILYPLAIGKMFGVGKKTCPRLEKMGIKTIGDFAKSANNNDSKLIDTMGKTFYVLKDWVNGLGSDTINMEPEDPKSIGHSSTFSHDTDSLDEINEMFFHLSKAVSERVIRHHKIGNTVQIVVKEADFTVHNKSITFASPTNNVQTIFEYAKELYRQNFSGLTVRLVGVTLQNLVDPKDMAIQMSLFDYERHEEESTTKLLINELNRKYKKNVVMRASEVEKK